MSSKRCVHDLLVEQCAFCNGANARHEASAREARPPFQAMYAGDCAGCGTEFLRGDEIRFDAATQGYLAECCA